MINRIYFNLNEYQKESKRLFKKIQNSAENIVPIVKYILFVFKNYEDGVIGPKKFAYDIASLLFLNNIQNEDLNEIIGEAGELELPDKYITGDPAQRLTNMIKTIRRVAMELDIELNDSELKGGQSVFENDSNVSITP